MVTTGGAFFFFDLEAGPRGIEVATFGIGSSDSGAGGYVITEALESCGAGTGGAGIGGLSGCDAGTEALGGCATGIEAVGSAGGATGSLIGAATVGLVGTEAVIDCVGGATAGCVGAAEIGLVDAEAAISCAGAEAEGCVGAAIVTIGTAKAADGIGAADVGCVDGSEA
jgi:hypothetical protein